MQIRHLSSDDLADAAAVHQAAFPRQQASREWLACNLAAYPRMQLFVAEREGTIVGFIHWTQKSGFRAEVVLELEQLAVHPHWQGQGIGSWLIRQSLPKVKAQLAQRGASVKHLLVTTRADNAAQRLYRKVLAARVEATISNLYSADEVVMVARDIP